MPINVSIQGEKNIYMYFKFEDPWTLQEFLEADSLGGAWVRNLDGEVDAIFDFSDISALPSFAISEALNAIQRTQKLPNQGATVVIISSPLVKRIVQVVAALAPSYGIHIAHDLRSAIEIIAMLESRRQYQYYLSHKPKQDISLMKKP